MEALRERIEKFLYISNDYGFGGGFGGGDGAGAGADFCAGLGSDFCFISEFLDGDGYGFGNEASLGNFTGYGNGCVPGGGNVYGNGSSYDNDCFGNYIVASYNGEKSISH